jgi:microcystin degradation protein MlrC
MLRALIAGGAKSAADRSTSTIRRACRPPIKAGTGNACRVALGGRIDPEFGAPIETEARVQSLSDGSFVNDGRWRRACDRDGTDRGAAHRRVEVIVISNRCKTPTCRCS